MPFGAWMNRFLGWYLRRLGSTGSWTFGTTTDIPIYGGRKTWMFKDDHRLHSHKGRSMAPGAL